MLGLFSQIETTELLCVLGPYTFPTIEEVLWISLPAESSLA